jgi:hypothetical protein
MRMQRNREAGKSEYNANDRTCFSTDDTAKDTQLEKPMFVIRWLVLLDHDFSFFRQTSFTMRDFLVLLLSRKQLFVFVDKHKLISFHYSI